MKVSPPLSGDNSIHLERQPIPFGCSKPLQKQWVAEETTHDLTLTEAFSTPTFPAEMVPTAECNMIFQTWNWTNPCLKDTASLSPQVMHNS